MTLHQKRHTGACWLKAAGSGPGFGPNWLKVPAFFREAVAFFQILLKVKGLFDSKIIETASDGNLPVPGLEGFLV
ncbi:hypothetical protein ACXO2U_07550 [Lactobacillus delbrueckii subsp. bulgaricus]